MSFSRFLRDRSGAIAPMYAILLVPLIGLTGAAVDYSRANLVRTAMQASLDAAALMLSKEVSGISSGQVTQKATDYFNANFNHPEVQTPTIIATYTAASSTLTVTGSASIPTMFMRVMGISSMTINSTATAIWGITKLRVAFALDNTGSMASNNKIGALKTATHQLLTTLQGLAINSGDVQVAIVPFAKDVAVDSSSSTATWLDWTRWEAEPPGLATKPSNWTSVTSGSSCPLNDTSHGVHCMSGPTNGSATTNTVTLIPTSGTYKGYICPSLDTGSKDSQNLGRYYNGCYTSATYTCTGSACTCTGHASCTCTGSGSTKNCKQPIGYIEHLWRPTGTAAALAHTTWNGCITDRGDPANDNVPSAQNTDQLVTTPAIGVVTTLFPADQYSYCNAEMLGLGYNWTALNSLVDQMQPNGSTNQPIGLVWAWQALTTGDPLNAPALTDNTTLQVIILLSDGLNTQDRWYGDGSHTSTQVDSRMYISTAGTCANIKAAGVVIYTVQVNVNSADPTSTVMQNCASKPENFFMLTTSGQIVDTFALIGTKLTQLRLSQ